MCRLTHLPSRTSLRRELCSGFFLEEVLDQPQTGPERQQGQPSAPSLPLVLSCLTEGMCLLRGLPAMDCFVSDEN